MIETAVCVPRGRGSSSFFMEVSGRGKRVAVPARQQRLCRYPLPIVASLPMMTSCVHSPLSTMAPASEVARSVTALWWSMAAGTGVILLLMTVLAIVALRQNPPHAPQWRGLRVLLIGGGLVLPGVTIAVLLAFGLRLDEAQWPSTARAEAQDAFHVDVIAHRWWWELRYPGLKSSQPVAAAAPPVTPAHEARAGSAHDERVPRTVNVLHVPAGVPIHLRIMSSDVIHGFWVPRVSGKLDAVPGRVNRLRLMVDEPGEYAGVCVEYCGEGHAEMPFTLVAHPPGDRQALLQAIRGAAQ